MIYMVSYTLNPPRENLQLEAALKQTAWAHHFSFTWLVATNETIEVLYNRLAPHFTQADRLLIMPIERSEIRHGWMTQDFWDWLNTVRQQGY